MGSGKGDWFHKMKELVHFNLNSFGSNQSKFNTYRDFENSIKNITENK